MEVKATYKYARISPLKARDVVREVTGLPVSNALDILRFTPKKAAFLVSKTLKSAIANAENNHDLSADDLIVKSATVGDGPAFKRWKPRARGGAAPIKKRTAHINIILTDEVPVIEKAPKAAPADQAGAKKAPAKKTVAKKAAPAKEIDAEVEVEGSGDEKKNS